MILRQLEYLTALAREGHFGRAADACHASQPALSAGLRKLEAELGVQIVGRGQRFDGFTPTSPGSTGTAHGALVTHKDYADTAIAFGIRGFGMAAILNGMSLHGGFRVFGSTFLVFSDYRRPALRLSALMRRPVVYVFTQSDRAGAEPAVGAAARRRQRARGRAGRGGTGRHRFGGPARQGRRRRAARGRARRARRVRPGPR